MFRRVPAALQAALGLALLLATAAPSSDDAYAQGRSGAAERCQQGGYSVLVPQNRPPFRNTGDCVHYLDQGGLVMSSAPRLIVSPSPVPPGTPWSNLTFTGSGFAPYLTIHMKLDSVPPEAVSSAISPFGSDASGGFTLSGIAWDTKVNCIVYNGYL